MFRLTVVTCTLFRHKCKYNKNKLIRNWQTWTSLTTSWSSTSANTFRSCLLNALLKSDKTRQYNDSTACMFSASIQHHTHTSIAYIQVLSRSWDGWPCHSKVGWKVRGLLCLLPWGSWVPIQHHLADRGVPLHQVVSWSTQPFSHNRYGTKSGGLQCPFLGETSSYLTQCRLGRDLPPYQLPSGILIHPAVWPQQTWVKIGGSAPFWGSWSPSSIIWFGPRTTSIPSGILIHPAVWPQ